MKISSRNLTALSGITELIKRTRSLATLDTILEPEWEFRYYSFNSKWDKGEQLASMRDGSGSFYFILFNSSGSIIKGFDRESPLGIYNEANGTPWPGVLDSVPSAFNEFLTEPAFFVGEATFCLWREFNDDLWRTGSIAFPNEEDPDGSERLLYILDGDPLTFKEWAEGYHEKSIPIDSIGKIYEHRPLTDELVQSLNPGIEMKDVIEDVEEIGYPHI